MIANPSFRAKNRFNNGEIKSGPFDEEASR